MVDDRQRSGGFEDRSRSIVVMAEQKGLAVVSYGLVAKAAGTVFTGLVGVSAYEILRKAVGTAPVHWAAVTATEWGLRGTRRAEVAAESARLKVADVVAEARERIGGDAPPLAAATAEGDDCC